MNAAKAEAAKFRMSLAGASAIGLLESAVAHGGKFHGLDYARSYIAEWRTAKEELDAAIAERDPNEIEEATVRA